MASSTWQPVPRVDFRKLHDARMQAHYAAQWLARVARAYVPKRPDDGHTNLGWDDEFGGLLTHPLPFGTRIGLRLANLTLAIEGGPSLPLDGRADTEVRRWLGEKLSPTGLDPKKLDAPSPYEMPEHVIALGARYSLDELIEPFRALAAWYADANAVLGSVQQELAKHKLKAPAVRCWPHHFDLDCLVGLGRGRTMGIGFSPGDEYCDEPYFYVTMYPEPSIPGLPLLPALGHWHTHEFLAAFAPAHKIVAALDQGVFVANYLDAAIKAALHALHADA
jgi:hypothetical protein